MKQIGILIGSLRQGSYNKKIARYLLSQFPTGSSGKILDISELPVYNEDLDRNPPPDSWVRFRNSAREMDGFLFVTPEYNRSIPAVIKNALDVGSRPMGSTVWSKKPGAIITASPGSLGGFGSNHHLRQCMVSLDVCVMPQPEAYLGNIAAAFDENNELISKETISFLHNFMEAFGTWVEKF